MSESSEVTVGIDIGTSSVKAVAADADGNVVARARIPHDFHVPSPLRFEHDAAEAWHRRSRAARSRRSATCSPRGVSVAAMVPSLTAVDDDGVPLRARPALRRRARASAAMRRAVARSASSRSSCAGTPNSARRAWLLDGAGRREPRADGPSRHLDDGRGDRDAAVRLRTGGTRISSAATGARVEQLPEIGVSGHPLAEVDGYDDCVLEGGTIDAMGEQIVAGADEPGDVLVILGTTLIVWAVVPDLVGRRSVLLRAAHRARRRLARRRAEQRRRPVPRLGRARLGGSTGPSAVTTRSVRTTCRSGCRTRAANGCRSTTRRDARELVDLNLTHDAAAIRRAAFEASGFVTRRMIDASPVPARRIVATGGGTRVEGWVEALADATGCRCTSPQFPKAARSVPRSSRAWPPGSRRTPRTRSRWARVDRVVDPDPAWEAPVEARYGRFRELAR